jgi:hypothetical protein
VTSTIRSNIANLNDYKVSFFNSRQATEASTAHILLPLGCWNHPARRAFSSATQL